MAVRRFRCVECNEEAEELHRDYSNGILKITRCRSCHKPVDKYIEYDAVIILIDATLCKVQAFRHILFNTEINIHWKLCVFCLLCEAYLRWSLLQASPASGHFTDIIRYTIEWQFYSMFAMAAVELMVFCLSVLLILWSSGGFSGVRYTLLMKAILLSSYGKVLLIPAIIWEHDFSPHCFSLIRLFVLTSNSQALRVILNCSWRRCLLAVVGGFLLETWLAQALRTMQLTSDDYLSFI
ncbi:hypothetical protein DNTS_005245 [Danionella cerebrum]|uniref:Protein ARV n=1 Tax=Danionella cerebrum TaxID=2873325 RepID=A0A553PUG2_9TELE|nr:hypothetical protein DNTS_005245 [Danionella translucida]